MRKSLFLAMGLILAGVGCATGGALTLHPDLLTSPDRFTATDYGSIVDHATDLEWMLAPDRNTYVADAQRFVLSLDAGRHRDWRLPSASELRSIRRPGAGTNNLPPPFETSGEMVWSCAHSLFGYCYLRLEDGTIGYDTRGLRKHGFRAFAVRTWQPAP